MGAPQPPTSGFIPPPSPSLRYATSFPSCLQPHLFHGCSSLSFPCQAPSPNPLCPHAQPLSRMWVSPSDLAGLPFPILPPCQAVGTRNWYSVQVPAILGTETTLGDETRRTLAITRSLPSYPGSALALPTLGVAGRETPFPCSEENESG